MVLRIKLQQRTPTCWLLAYFRSLCPTNQRSSVTEKALAVAHFYFTNWPWPLSTHMSSSSSSSSFSLIEKRYWNPEHPPPSTLIRRRLPSLPHTFFICYKQSQQEQVTPSFRITLLWLANTWQLAMIQIIWYFTTFPQMQFSPELRKYSAIYYHRMSRPILGNSEIIQHLNLSVWFSAVFIGLFLLITQVPGKSGKSSYGH